MLTLTFTLNPAEKHSQFLQIKKALLQEAKKQLLSMLKRWQPYMDCPWKQKCRVQLNIEQGRIKIILPFLTFFDNAITAPQAAIQKMLAQEKISTCTLTSAIATQEKNTRFIMAGSSKKDGYGYPESAYPELKTDEKLIAKKYTSLSSDDMTFKYFPWQSLPVELLSKIAVYLCHPNFMQTCQLFYSVTQATDFWENLLKQHFPEFTEFAEKKPDFFAKVYQLLFTAHVLQETPLDHTTKSDQRATIMLQQLSDLVRANSELKQSPWVNHILGFCNAHGLGQPQQRRILIF